MTDASHEERREIARRLVAQDDELDESALRIIWSSNVFVQEDGTTHEVVPWTPDERDIAVTDPTPFQGQGYNMGYGNVPQGKQLAEVLTMAVQQQYDDATEALEAGDGAV